MSINTKQFAVDILTHLNAPVNHQNVAALVGWANAEGGATHNNPFNTTESAPGATSMNSVGVKTYTDYNEALHATLATLHNGRYGSIIGALHSSNPNAFVGAVGSSPWGTTGSLLSETVHNALGENFGLKGATAIKSVGKQRVGPPGQPKTTSQTITDPGVTTKTTSGGGLDVKAAVLNALLTPTPINTTTGTPPASGSLLSKVMANVNSGAYTTPVVNTISKSAGQSTTITNKTIAKARAMGGAGQQGITNQAVNDAAAAGAPADVQHLLKMVHNVNGAAYSQANHNAIDERDVNIKAEGTDCSGFVSWLMGPHGLGIWKTSLATPSINTAPGIQAGKGREITIWNNNQAGNAGHVFIQIGTGKSAQYWASEGGGVGIHQLPLSEVQNYIQNGSDGGRYVALHPKGL